MINPLTFRSQKSPRWRKVPKDGRGKAEMFLRQREKYCVSASARFLTSDEKSGHLWYLNDSAGEISALLLHSRHSLFPVFDKGTRVPGPRFLNRFLGKIHIHALQGLREDVRTLQNLMEEQGYFASDKIDYELMSLDAPPKSETLRAGPAGLTLRPPFPEDVEALFALQSAYEQEEVVPGSAAFNPAACRLNLEHILAREHVLLAELDGQVIGKINTSAESFTRYQIGGVYVRPDCRSMGIGLKMTAVFLGTLLARGRGISLFVKKRNAAARTVYRKIGFSVLGDYQISYY